MVAAYLGWGHHHQDRGGQMTRQEWSAWLNGFTIGVLLVYLIMEMLK